MDLDTYKTIAESSIETLFKDKNSKFYGIAFPVQNEEEVKHCLEEVQKKHAGAGHYCYAYKIGIDDFTYRANDDGEPNNSAGMPIYGQIQSFELTNVLIVVARYFGGVKLGVSGLISAYRTSAQLTLEASKIVTKTIMIYFQLNFNYDKMSKVMRILKERNITVENQKLTLACEYVISVRKNDATSTLEIFHNLYQVEIVQLDAYF